MLLVVVLFAGLKMHDVSKYAYIFILLAHFVFSLNNQRVLCQQLVITGLDNRTPYGQFFVAYTLNLYNAPD
jgi:hypothetical protein